MRTVAGKSLRFARDILIVFGSFLGGSLWLTLTWPRADALFGLFMLLGAVAGAAKLNVAPFVYPSPLVIFHSYFPSKTQEAEYRHVGWACYRFGFILMLIPALCYPIVEEVAKTGERIQYYAIEVIAFFVSGMYFLFRGFFAKTKGDLRRYMSKYHHRK